MALKERLSSTRRGIGKAKSLPTKMEAALAATAESNDHLRFIVERLARIDENNKTVLEQLQCALGRIESRQTSNIGSESINDYEFRVFSQWGEDGIIQHLVRNIPIAVERFIEFGVEDYKEANTRFLLVNNNWSGFVLDGSKENIERLKNSELYWRHDLTARSAFITKENINQLIAEAGYDGQVGILSVDIDGNDYWVWEAIDNVDAAIVIVEYNHRFGAQEQVTIPYKPEFVRSKAHYSMVYAGASLAALAALGDSKGYDLVGTSSGGNNAFFVKKSLRPKSIKKLTPVQAFHRGKFREARNKKGLLSYATLDEELKILKGLPLVNVGRKSRDR